MTRASGADRRAAPIGVFDSGVGGLTVLAALERELPDERYVYLGDTARLPYGTKSAETVVRYALQAAGLLVDRGVKALVVACNTASAAALATLRERHPQLPVIGVIEPGAEAACETSRSGRICVIATEGTVRGAAYERAIAGRRADAQVLSIPCQLFVALAEEGWGEGEVARLAAQRYLRESFADARAPDTLVLGCTHFPLLRAAIAAAIPPGVTIVDSAATTARAVRAELERLALAAQPGVAAPPGVATEALPDRAAARSDGRSLLLATDGVERFVRVGGRFLGRALRASDVELVDL